MPYGRSPSAATLYWQPGDFFSGRSPCGPRMLLRKADRRAGSAAAVGRNSRVDGDETVLRSLQCRWLGAVPNRYGGTGYRNGLT